MEDQKTPKKELIHDLNSSRKKGNSMAKPLMITIVVGPHSWSLGLDILHQVLGVEKGPVSVNSSSSEGKIEKEFPAGVNDTKAFPDTAEGKLEAGGIDGEGEYHLVRPGETLKCVYDIISGRPIPIRR